MSKFYNIEGQSVVVEAALEELRPVNEGWGEAIGNLVSIFVPAVAGAIGGTKLGEKLGGNGLFGNFLSGFGAHILGFTSAAAGFILFNAATAKKFFKIIEHPKVKEYLLQEADNIFKEVKKKDKSVVTKWDNKDRELEKAAEKGDLDVPGFMSCIKYMKSAEIEVGKYSILLMGDSSELKRIVLVLYSENAYHLILRDIPVPSKEQMNEWMKEEGPAKESMEIATEGWGTAILKAFGVYGSGVACIALGAMFGKTVPGLIAGIFASLKAMNAIDMAANKDLKKLIERQDIKSFIEKEADKAFKEAKKENKNLDPNVEEALKSVQHMDEAEEDDRSWITKYFTKLARCFLNVGKYTVIATGDIDSVDTLYLLMFDKEANKVVKKALPLPAIKKEE